MVLSASRKKPKPKNLSSAAKGALFGTAIGIAMSGGFRTEAAHKLLHASEIRRESKILYPNSPKRKALLREANRLEKRAGIHGTAAVASLAIGPAAGLGLGALKGRRKRRNLRKKQNR